MRRTAIILASLLAAAASVASSAGAQVSDVEILSQGGDAEAQGYVVSYYDSTDDLSKVYFGSTAG